jgi:hypothetical protein
MPLRLLSTTHEAPLSRAQLCGRIVSLQGRCQGSSRMQRQKTQSMLADKFGQGSTVIRCNGDFPSRSECRDAPTPHLDQIVSDQLRINAVTGHDAFDASSADGVLLVMHVAPRTGRFSGSLAFSKSVTQVTLTPPRRSHCGSRSRAPSRTAPAGRFDF